MAEYYTAFTKVREITECNAPYEPCRDYGSDEHSLKAEALRFLHESCTELRFSKEKEAREEATGKYLGKSLRNTTIPYNMQCDVDRLCLERSLGDFLDTGLTEDAYKVYYCYLDMFLGGYAASRRMIEFLSEYEHNGSSLLTKHRDHYVHSVYVFALGLSVYQTNEEYRNAFAAYCSIASDEKKRLAHLFLERWGLCSLFHDIGYPFELPFEQVVSYFVDERNSENDKKKQRKAALLPVYPDMGNIASLMAETPSSSETFHAVEFAEELAENIVTKLQIGDRFDIHAVAKLIARKPGNPGDYGCYMDHAYFSAVLLHLQLKKLIDKEVIGKQAWHYDVLSAIMLHNSLYKYSIRKESGKRLKMQDHPLAFLLMLCDELQCWDRTAYGRSSRHTQYPADAELDFSDGIHITYQFSAEVGDRFLRYRLLALGSEDPDKTAVSLLEEDPSLKEYRNMQKGSDEKENSIKFLDEITDFLDCGGMGITIETGFLQPGEVESFSYLSGSSFTHLFDLAMTLHTLKHPDWKLSEREKRYQEQSLEYQLSGINRAKEFAAYLDKIGCFYTDRLIRNKEVKYLTDEELETIAPLEHGRWIREHQKMGWKPYFGPKTLDKQTRELRRCHPLMLWEKDPSEERIRFHYENLPQSEKEKDKLAFADLQLLLKEQDGVRIYRIRP